MRMQEKPCSLPLKKSIHEAQSKENADIFDFSLTEEDMKLLQSLDQNQPIIGQPENPDFVEKAMTW